MRSGREPLALLSASSVIGSLARISGMFRSTAALRHLELMYPASC